MKYLVLYLLFLSFNTLAVVLEAPPNSVDYQQNPSKMEWHKIDTEHFEIIFSEDILEEAQRVAHLLEKAYPYVTRSLEVAPPKISLILQNQSTMSNGFVTLAPRRTEWYVTPAIDPELSNTEWLKTLSIHEFRHVVQFQKTRRGFNKVLGYLFGEIGQAIGLGLTAPPWFLEGDAVGMETALTKGGRGRLPLFERDLRTLLLSGKKFDYDQAHLGSYKNWIPNHYVYGYFYTTYLRNQYGDLFLSKLINNAAVNSFNPLTFYNSYAYQAEESFEKFYKKTMKDMIRQWDEKFQQLKPTPYAVTSIAPRPGWTNYFFPQVERDGTVIALKRGLSHIDHFVKVGKEKDETLFYPGVLMNEYPYKVRGDRMAYLEYELDPRWGYRDFARLRVFDLDTKSHRLDLRKTKLRLAVLDHDGQKILAVDWNTKQHQSIVVLTPKGKEITRIPYPKDQIITSMDWINDFEIVMVTKDHDDQKSLVKFSLVTQVEEVLLQKSIHNLGFVSVEEGHIFIEGPQSGIDNVFLVENGALRQITSAAFGAYAPKLFQGKLFYNDYTANGMNVVTKELPWEEEQASSDSFIPFYEKFAAGEDKLKFESDLLEKQEYKVKPYDQFKKAINLHSWILLAPPLSSTLTVAAISRDVMNKFSLAAGGEYNLNERAMTGFVSGTWSQYYTVFDLRAAYGGRRQEIRRGGVEVTDKWEEGTAEAGVSVPWKRITGRFVHNFSLRAFSKVIKVVNKLSNDRTEITDGAMFSPGAHAQYSVLARPAKRDILPPWGLVLAGHAEEGKDITGNGERGSLQTADSRLFLPGLFNHHSFYHQFAYERQRDDFYQYSSYVFYPRGTRNVFLQEFTKYSGNYIFPLMTPDVHWSRYIYLKRISLNLFYDSLRGRYRTFGYNASSTGWELHMETNFLRLFIPISWGIRGNYILEGREGNNYELFLSTVVGVY
jgi:hypothetical protein